MSKTRSTCAGVKEEERGEWSEETTKQEMGVLATLAEALSGSLHKEVAGVEEKEEDDVADDVPAVEEDDMVVPTERVEEASEEADKGEMERTRVGEVRDEKEEQVNPA